MGAESFDLRLVAPFVAVARSATYALAAAELGMTPHVLLERVGRLERQLGARLVDKDGRRVVLTPAGERFLVEARTILDRARQVAAALRVEPDTVRVRIVAAAGSDQLRSAMGRFAAEHPDVHLAVGGECSSTEASEALRRGDVDVAVDYPYAGAAGMSYATWNRMPFALVCGPHHRLAGHPGATWSDLRGERVLMAPPGVVDAYNIALRAALGHAGVQVEEVRGPPVTNLRYTTPLVARGDASVVLPAWACAVLPPGLVCLPLSPVQEVEVGVFWNAVTTGPAARRFIAVLRSLAPAPAAPAAGPALVDLGS